MVSGKLKLVDPRISHSRWQILTTSQLITSSEDEQAHKVGGGDSHAAVATTEWGREGGRVVLGSNRASVPTPSAHGRLARGQRPGNLVTSRGCTHGELESGSSPDGGQAGGLDLKPAQLQNQSTLWKVAM